MYLLKYKRKNKTKEIWGVGVGWVEKEKKNTVVQKSNIFFNKMLR